MSAFRVGQRVRIVSAKYVAEAMGRAAVITGPATLQGDWCLCIDGLGAIHPCGANYCAFSYQLEPILPEGAAPSTWAECAWQPEHLRAAA